MPGKASSRPQGEGDQGGHHAQKESVILPAADIINHRRATVACPTSGGGLLKHVTAADAVEIANAKVDTSAGTVAARVVATRDIAKGEEITHSYGRNRGFQLWFFLDYGFVETTNPDAVCPCSDGERATLLTLGATARGTSEAEIRIGYKTLMTSLHTITMSVLRRHPQNPLTGQAWSRPALVQAGLAELRGLVTGRLQDYDQRQEKRASFAAAGAESTRGAQELKVAVLLVRSEVKLLHHALRLANAGLAMIQRETARNATAQAQNDDDDDEAAAEEPSDDEIEQVLAQLGGGGADGDDGPGASLPGRSRSCSDDLLALQMAGLRSRTFGGPDWLEFAQIAPVLVAAADDEYS